MSPPAILDGAWSVAGFVFDDAKAPSTRPSLARPAEYWIEKPETHPFYQRVYRGWVAGSYQPPETKPVRRTLERANDAERVELHEFAYRPFSGNGVTRVILKRTLPKAASERRSPVKANGLGSDEPRLQATRRRS